MNIIQIHNKIRVLLDNENSPRHLPATIDELIQTAITLIVDDRYGNEKKGPQQGGKNYSFQSTSKLRDQLYTLVKKTATAMTAVADTIPATAYPSDFMYLVSPIVNINGMTAIAVPLTYEEEAVIHFDPKRRPSIIYPARIYFIEHAGGFRIIWGAQGTLTNAHMYYIKTPASVFYGVEETNNVALQQYEPDGNGIGNKTLIAVTVVTLEHKLIAAPNTAVVGTIQPGTRFTLTWDPLATYKILTGIAVKDSVDCDLPANLHEEVARRTAALINGTIENFDRKIDLQREDIN